MYGSPLVSASTDHISDANKMARAYSVLIARLRVDDAVNSAADRAHIERRRQTKAALAKINRMAGQMIRRQREGAVLWTIRQDASGTRTVQRW